MTKTVEWDQINWDLLKIEYEFFNKPLQQIAQETNIPHQFLIDKVQHDGWTPHPLAQQIATIKDLTTATEDYNHKVEEKLRLLSNLKQEIFAPEYLKLEFSLLAKASQILHQIKEGDPTAHNKLKALTSVFKDLLSGNGLLASSAAEANRDGDELNVKIQMVAETDDGSKTAIQVQAKKLPARTVEHHNKT